MNTVSDDLKSVFDITMVCSASGASLTVPHYLQCCGIFVSKAVLLAATISNAILLAASFTILCVGIAIECRHYDYFLDCSEKTGLTIAGGVLTGIFSKWCLEAK